MPAEIFEAYVEAAHFRLRKRKIVLKNKKCLKKFMHAKKMRRRRRTKGKKLFISSSSSTSSSSYFVDVIKGIEKKSLKVAAAAPRSSTILMYVRDTYTRAHIH